MARLLCQWCKLSCIGTDVLALGNLAYLNVYENRLKTLPRELNSLPLRHLVAVGNEIQALPDELFKRRLRTTLEYLDISFNQVRVGSQQQLLRMCEALLTSHTAVGLAIGHCISCV